MKGRVVWITAAIPTSGAWRLRIAAERTGASADRIDPDPSTGARWEALADPNTLGHEPVPEIWPPAITQGVEIKRREIEFPSLQRTGERYEKWIPFEKYGRKIGLIRNHSEVS